MIHNHEVAGSCPALATGNKGVTNIEFVTPFYLHVTVDHSKKKGITD